MNKEHVQANMQTNINKHQSDMQTNMQANKHQSNMQFCFKTITRQSMSIIFLHSSILGLDLRSQFQYLGYWICLVDAAVYINDSPSLSPCYNPHVRRFIDIMSVSVDIAVYSAATIPEFASRRNSTVCLF